MPRYDVMCAKCEHEWEDIFPMAAPAPPCPKCESRKTERVIRQAPLMRCRDSGWETENQGRGRRFSQLAKSLDDPNCYFRSRGEAKEAAKRRGMRVQDA